MPENTKIAANVGGAINNEMCGHAGFLLCLDIPLVATPLDGGVDDGERESSPDWGL